MTFSGRFRLALAAAFLAALALSSGPALAAGREGAAAEAARPRLAALLAQKKLKEGDPVFLRIFKEESVLEMWMKPVSGEKYILFKTWPICAWSGTLGPKTRQGDRQAPEGFYAVGARHLNPYSNYHLSFNLGYPNAYEKSQGYTGSLLMVHGDCRSDGCYAMTDEGIEEIYTLIKGALSGGQSFFRVHAFPFRLDRRNLARHQASPWHDYWQMMAPVYTDFETNRIPPEVLMDNGRYRLAGN